MRMWAAMGIGRMEFPIVAQACLLGGHVRVGLEDNLYLGRGELAPSNAALVERAATLVELLGGSIATPAEARSILGLDAAPLTNLERTSRTRRIPWSLVPPAGGAPTCAAPTRPEADRGPMGLEALWR